MEELKDKGMNSNSQYMRFVVDFHNMMVNKKITLAYEGEVTQEITKAFTSMTERNLDKVEENGKIKKKSIPCNGGMSSKYFKTCG